MKDSKKHRWYDVILAWANGDQIQCQGADTAFPHWRDYEYSEVPAFNDNKYMWRIKPKTVTKKYRMALVKPNQWRGDVIAVDVTNSSIDDPIEYNIREFIRWVGEPVDVEIEV